MVLYLKRNRFKKQTEGILEVYKEGECIFKCHSLELPWKNNEKNISCIPDGVYKAQKEINTWAGKCLRLPRVKNRTGILIHVANFSYQLKGCIAVGDELTDIDRDGLKDVKNSRKTMNELYDILDNDLVLAIKT